MEAAAKLDLEVAVKEEELERQAASANAAKASGDRIGAKGRNNAQESHGGGFSSAISSEMGDDIVAESQSPLDGGADEAELQARRFGVLRRGMEDDSSDTEDPASGTRMD